MACRQRMEDWEQNTKRLHRLNEPV
jgi:hypothetical protein